ncbi:4-vinyl reductase [Candidatus Fermentibacteria bacterium]|nr:4-vinyl reductase [Candidatus Fermentibacteria bacterium]
MAKEPRIKASILNSAMVFVSQSLGEPAITSILTSFDSQELSGKRLLPSDWISEQTYRDFLLATAKYLASSSNNKKPREFFFEMGRFTATDGINKYYKSLIRMFDTKFMLTRSPLLWGIMHTHGSLKVEPVGKTEACVYIADLPAPCKEFCYTMEGYMYAVAELTKAKVIRVEEVECVMEGAKRCKYVGEWKQA